MSEDGSACSCGPEEHGDSEMEEEEEMEDEEYNCMWCSDSFATYAALIEHANLHDFDVRRTCGDCGACFTRLQQFKNHQCAGLFACGHCGHRFASNDARRLHLQLKHAGVRLRQHPRPNCRAIL